MSLQSIEVCTKVLENWKDSNTISFKDTISTLIEINDYSADTLNQTITLVTKTVKDISTNKQQCHQGFMEQILKLKKSLKDKEQLLKKKEISSAKKEVKAANTEKQEIVVPPTLGSQLPQTRKKLAVFLYTCFLQNFKDKYDEATLSKYILTLQQQINEMFEGDASKITKHLGKMKINLISPKSNFAKREMLAGRISAKELATNKTALFEDKSEAVKVVFQDEKEQKLQGQGQQCEKCHAMEAYCTMMQQIRASDEPMTRFMRCRACKETWTD